LALYLHTDSSNIFNKGFSLGYAENPAPAQTTTDISTFLFSWTGANWIFIYAA